MSQRLEGLIADTIVIADNVITCATEATVGRSAILIVDGSIAGVVPAAEAERNRDQGTVVYDVGRSTVMPGFVDPHAHVEVASRVGYETVDCRAPERRSVTDVLDTLTDAVSDSRDGWVVAQANLFFDQKLEERRFPTREELDAVSDSVAIGIRAGGHLSVLNSRALELCGITENYRPVSHSITGMPEVHRDAYGRPSGIVTEMDNLIPWPTLSPAEHQQALINGVRRLFTCNGVTTVGEISETQAGLDVYAQAARGGQLGTRILAYLWTPGTVSLDDACTRDWQRELAASRELFRVHGVKMFSDGGYSARRAALTRPYLDPAFGRGEVALSNAQIREAKTRTREAGLQLAIHANGDRAQLEVCDALARVPGGTGSAPKTRVEHAGNFVPDYELLTAAWEAADIIPVPQPVFIYNFGQFVPGYVGDYAQDRQFPFRRLLDDGWALSGSSDVWVGSEAEQTLPFFSVCSAMTRRTFHGHQLTPDQAIGIEEALVMHTKAGAAALGLDDRGSLESGKLADLIVLSVDPRTIPAEAVKDVEVNEVFLAGQRVHTSQALSDSEPQRASQG